MTDNFLQLSAFSSLRDAWGTKNIIGGYEELSLKPGRNESCPCGSGKKYKKCCHGKLEVSSRQHLQHQTQPATHKIPNTQEINTLMARFAEGRYTEAATLAQAMTLRLPLYDLGWKVLGVAFVQMGQSADALVPLKKAASLSPSDAEIHNNLGIALRNMGQLDEAEASFRRAVQIKPDNSEAFSNLGITLMDMHRPDEAKASYRRALEIKPDNAVAHSNLGNTLKDMGELNEAEASFRRALQIKPDFVEAHYNLGNILMSLGRLDEAEASFRRALQIKPDFVDSLSNLALLLNAQGKSVMAFNIIKQSLQIKETREAKSVFVDCIKRLCFTQDDSEIRNVMVRALTEPWGRPSDLARIGANFAKLNPDIGGCVLRATDAWPQRLIAKDLFGKNGLVTLATDPLLCALLDSYPICDIEMERFLAMARHTMLEAANQMMALDCEIGIALRFYSALARQCFINEYVFSYTDEEIQKACVLRDSLAAALKAKTQVPALWLVAVAAYFPLFSIPFAVRLLDSQWPNEVAAVLVQQVREPEEELQLRGTIPQITNIENEVSLQVQRQYEENPYPRWIKAAPAGKATDIVGYLRQKFPLVSFKSYRKNSSVDVLIAGCGTGQHSIQTAQQFHGAQMLAIDLSLSSLSYAKRKTHELSLTSIEYAQADLLKLDSLDRSFDIVESSGVLHHLADPFAGWRVLLSLLRPGGFMRLGFYSDVARRNLVKVRTFIAEKGYGTSANEIRRCRQDLIDSDKIADFGTTLQISDFFSISNCRDMLFHVQEHRMTLTDIDKFLRGNNLTFLGFELNGDILHAYKQCFPDDCAATNLNYWQIFENENPDTFIGMYQFWIKKDD